MTAQEPDLKPKRRSRRRIRNGDTLDGEYFFSTHVADSPCEAAFYIVPHNSAPMFKVGWSLAADRRLDKINEIWGKQLGIYSAIVMATSREAAVLAEHMMKLFLGNRGWKIDGLPPLEGHSEFFSTEGLLYAYDKCMQQILPMMHTLEERTHVITARGADESVEEAFADIVKERTGKAISPDSLLASMIRSKLRSVDIPKIVDAMTWERFPESVIAALAEALRSKYTPFAAYADALWTKFGAALLREPKQFLKIVSRYGVDSEKNLLDLLEFIGSHKVVMKEQSCEWLTEVLGALSARAMVDFTASQHIDVRVLTFAQRTVVFKKLMREKDSGELLQAIPYRLDDLDHLKAEAMDLWTLERHCSDVELALYNLRHIPKGRTPDLIGIL